MEHSTKEVRELALRVILSLYRQHRGDVLDLLPPRDAAAPKRFLYKRLFDGFSQIDGNLTEIQDLEKGGILPDDEEEQLAGLEEEMTGRGIEGPRKQRHPEGQQQVTKEPPKACKAISGLTKGGRKRGGVNTQQPVRHLDSLCIFCGEEDESFTEDGLDLHYWEHCPMLHRCHECGQVVEVSGLSRHLLDECESRSRLRACPRCSQALPAEALTPHLQGSSCHPSRGGNRCPLCHSSFLPGEEAWKAHLMGKEGCKQNARRTAASWKTQPAQGKADKLKPWCSAGVRVVPVDRGRRPPFLVPVNTKGKH